jgi:hypothetical protein
MKKPSIKRDYVKKFVYSELINEGFLVSKKPKSDKGFHILCKSADGTKSARIRVAKSKNSMRVWTLNPTDEYYSSDLFYIFVGNKFLENPDFFVVPGKIVSERIIKDASDWRRGEREDGNPRKDINTRKFTIKDEEIKKYKNNWKLLGLD